MKRKFQFKKKDKNAIIEKVIDYSGQYGIFVTNYPSEMSPEAVIIKINSMIQQTNHVDLAITNKNLYADGIVFYLPNPIQVKTVLSLCGTEIGTKHLWIANYNEELAQLANPLSHVFQDSFEDNVMDLSKLSEKLSYVESEATIDMNNDMFMEFLFLRLGLEAKENNTVIRHLILKENNISHISNLDRLLWFLPGIIDIDFSKNQLTNYPELSRFSTVELINEYSRETSQRTGWSSNETGSWGTSTPASSSSGWGISANSTNSSWGTTASTFTSNGWSNSANSISSGWGKSTSASYGGW